ncbi:hypothetical protein KJ836_00315 [Patescibacteria group bacterium]|nr:hypothetical protein [Patescibacteria group bacterium]
MTDDGWRQYLKRSVKDADESVSMMWVWQEFGHLPSREMWSVIKAHIDRGPSYNASFYYHLATLILITSIPGIDESARSYVVSSLMSRQKLTKATLRDIVKFAPDENHRLEAKARLEKKVKIRMNKQIGLLYE